MVAKSNVCHYIQLSNSIYSVLQVMPLKTHVQLSSRTSVKQASLMPQKKRLLRMPNMTVELKNDNFVLCTQTSLHLLCTL